MAKNFIKKYLPDPELIRNHSSMKIFGQLLHDGNLWHLHRRSARGAFAAGLFAALMPMPGQTILAAALAIMFRVNVPISVALCWVTNPFTMAPIFYICYNIGLFVLGHPPQEVTFDPSFDWLLASINTIGKPFVVGSLIFATVVASLAWLVIDSFWRFGVARAWKKRLKQRQSMPQPSDNDGAA